MPEQDQIIIRGAAEHNLKKINLSLPKNKLIVFTGVSGSGKSSLAFDTLYAEGQRRYVESLNTYARQFLGMADKPKVETITGLSPAIAINQKAISQNPRSTVGTVTEIYDYLRVLFAKIGHPHCPQCGREISRQSPSQIKEKITQLIAAKIKKEGLARFFILSPLVKGRKGEFANLFQNLVKKGFSKVRIDSRFFSLKEDFSLLKNNLHNIDVVVDEISFQKTDLKNSRSFQWTRLGEAIKMALHLSAGQVIALEVNDPSFTMPEQPQKTKDYLFSELFACPQCGLSLPEIEPRTFSFNSPFGACPQCHGLGVLLKFSPRLVINPRLSVSEGGILPMPQVFYQETWFSRILRQAAKENQIPLRKPIKDIPQEKVKLLLYGTGARQYQVEGENRFKEKTVIFEKFRGIIGELNRRYQQTQSDFIRQNLERFMTYETCPLCRGRRLKKEALGITIDSKNISQITALSIKKTLAWIKKLNQGHLLSKREKTIAAPVFREIISRLNFLVSVGLEYLTLDRRSGTLSHGEAQRIRLASQIGSGLSGVLYVLDEPTIGLHPRDNYRLIKTLKKLRDLGNTVVVVEHDRQTIENADYIVDFGPGGGKRGGKIIAQGSPATIKKSPHSLTGQYLKEKKTIPIFPKGKTINSQFLVLKGCRQFNLKNINVSLPLGHFIGLTGVSGSGKSTLAISTIYRALAQKIGHPLVREKAGSFDKMEGEGNVQRVYLVDQSPIGRTPRSNPATYIGVFDDIRSLFAQLPEAKMRGYKKGYFSFNTKGGRCEACRGHGEMKIEMQFLPDVYVTCEVCHGKRFTEETLDITYKGKNIADVLEMTVAEAQEFFSSYPTITRKLKVLADIGLDYIKLGQPAPTLSGGEAQRIKIAHELVKQTIGHTLYILDEPSTGLHFADLEKLILILRRLVEKGNTVLVIEHNLDIIKNCDYLIDLGPGGGEKGGEIIASGTPKEVAQNPQSETGKYLKKILN